MPMILGGSGTINTSSSLAVTVAGVEDMRIDANGRVGIGTTSPSTLLHAVTSSVVEDVFRISNGTQNLNLGVNNGSGGSYLFEVGANALRFGTNNTERMRIDSSGRVTMPNQPAFRAYSSAGSYSTTGSDIVFGTTDFNIGGHYNTSNGRFTAPVSGVYHIIWSTSSFGAASFSLDLYINGNAQAYSEQNNSLTYFVSGQSQLRYLNAGDYATLRLRFGTINLSPPSTNFQAFLVG